MFNKKQIPDHIKIADYFIFLLVLALWPIYSWAGDDTAQDVLRQELNFLQAEAFRIKVVTASKKLQDIEDAPVPLYVITAEDLRLYGATNVGEALRMVPGIDVSQGGDQNYEVGLRGLVGRQYNTYNKVLWLINGRSVYNDALGGARLQSFNLAIDDIERIEVVRGPGSALYGANAFFGVINIITKMPADLAGFQANAAAGNLNQLQGQARQAGWLSQKLSYKIGFLYENLDQKDARLADKSAVERDSLLDLGYRIGSKHALQVTGANFSLRYDRALQSFLQLNGGYVDDMADHYYVLPGEMKYRDYFLQLDYKDPRTSWRVYFNGQGNGKYDTRRFLANREATHPYLLATGRRQNFIAPAIILKSQLLDVEYQRAFQFGRRGSLIAGASYRRNFVQSTLFSVDNELTNKEEDLTAAFGQFEYQIQPNLNLIAGGRVDHHSVVGVNFNPRVAMVYKPGARHVIRFGVSSATRNPHFLDMYVDAYTRTRNLRKATGLDPIYNLTAEGDYIILHPHGNPDLNAERLITVDGGYRVQLRPDLQVMIDVFVNHVVKTIEFTSPYVSERITQLENIHAIFDAQGADVSQLLPNILTREQMTAERARLEQLRIQLEQAGQTAEAARLQAVLGGLEKLDGVYDAPKVANVDVKNRNTSFQLYGGEISFNWLINKNVAIMANYAHLLASEDYNLEKDDGQTIPKTRNPKHKVNIGLKLQRHPFYGGVMFNYVSKQQSLADNNRDGVYDKNDADNYANHGIFTTRPRQNLNVNAGYRWRRGEVYATGFNLIQDGFLQYEFSASVTGADMLNRRFLAGIRLFF